MTDAAAELLALADAVRRLVPDRRDPERFHADKSDIAARLRRLARDAERRRLDLVPARRENGTVRSEQGPGMFVLWEVAR